MAGGDLNVKHLWIQGGGGDPANVNETNAEYAGQLGKIGTIKPAAGDVPRILQFVKRYSADTTVAAAANKVAYWQDQDNFVVCADQTEALGGSTYPIPAGVWLGTYPAAGNYGFIVVGGSAAITLDGVQTADVGVGEKIHVKGANADGLCVHASTAVPTDTTGAINWCAVAAQQQVGVALAAQTDSSGTAVVLLAIPRNGW
jgi:hypothetical protein